MPAVFLFCCGCGIAIDGLFAKVEELQKRMNWGRRENQD
jgi:hypothetical protein